MVTRNVERLFRDHDMVTPWTALTTAAGLPFYVRKFANHRQEKQEWRKKPWQKLVQAPLPVLS